MLTGRGTTKDEKQALVLLRQAADDGMPKAQFNLAMQVLRTPRDRGGNTSANSAKEAMQVRKESVEMKESNLFLYVAAPTSS